MRPFCNSASLDRLAGFEEHRYARHTWVMPILMDRNRSMRMASANARLRCAEIADCGGVAICGIDYKAPLEKLLYGLR